LQNFTDVAGYLAGEIMNKLQSLSESQSVGRDIRALRKARGMTLVDVADRMGRSVGWMSQVERDLSRPSIDELRRLAELFGVNISLFFGQAPTAPDEEGRIVRAAARRQLGLGEDGLIEELLSPDLTDDFEMFHSTFEPGAVLKDFVRRPTQEVGYLMSGRLRLFLGEKVFELTRGDSFRVRDEPYRWENPYKKPAVAIWVIAPPVY
jgi:transcriptional regulator with XRE-family HTH domain